MNMLQTFQSYYQQVLEPELQQLELQRKRTVTWVLALAVGLVVVLLVAAVALAQVLPPPGNLLVPLVICGIIGVLGYQQLSKGYRHSFKERVIRQIIRFVDAGLHYDPAGLISEHEFEASRIFTRSPDRYRGEDLVLGQVGGTALRFSEVHAEYKTTSTDSKGNTKTQWHTIFKGVFFIADFNKHFTGVTVVVPDSAERWFGRFGQSLQSLGARLGRGIELIKLEDPEFEEHFAAYGSDQIEARYILSTSLMRRILDFKRKTGRSVHLSFVASQINVAISSSKNLFEPPLFKSCLGVELAQDYLEDLLLVLGVVEDFKLNVRIWSKQ